MNAIDQTAFANRLMAGERIEWAGRPSQGIRFSGRDIFLIPFSLLWVGFAIFWEAAVAIAGIHTQSPVTLFMLIWGGAFVLIGLFFSVGRFFIDAALRLRTFYALTNQRLLILRTGLGGSFTSVGLTRLAEASLTTARDGRGTIRIGAAQGSLFGGGAGFRTWLPTLDPAPQLIGIKDAGSVFDRIQRLAASGVR